MATSGQLVHITAKALRLPEVTVELHYRALRKAGLVQKGGRGRSARQVDAMDAARLLIALMGARIVKEAPDAVERIGGFRHHLSEVDRIRPVGPAGWLPDGHTLEESIARLLTELSGIRPSRSSLDALRHVEVSLAIADETADLVAPKGSLHYVGGYGEAPSRGLRTIISLGIDGLFRLSLALASGSAPAAVKADAGPP